MKNLFIHDQFLLQSESARSLYHGYAKGQPIFDFHCHLPPAQIASNHKFADLYEIWLAGDHYKWRIMRANGVKERFCTGNGTPREKFDAFVATVPYALRNPVYDWSHLELSRTFKIDQTISPLNADEIWNVANARLESMTVKDILSANRVAVICTTDDPADSLEHHEAIRKSGLATRVYPTFRPDRALAIRDARSFNPWLERLEQAAGLSIRSFDEFLDALKKRHDDFHAIGARLSDHGLAQALAEPCSHAEAQAVFNEVRKGIDASPEGAAKYGSYLMLEFGRMDAAKGWTKQIHLGAHRNANSRQFRALGPDTGFDSISDLPQVQALSRYLDSLETAGLLPRMVVYNLNPADNYAIATLLGNFNGESIAGKLQFGSGWWYLDQREAMEWQINTLSNLGLLRRFVGMLTDSRSFMSYTRHEYFRRVLCNLLGSDLEMGRLPGDVPLIGSMVKEICFGNARNYFRLGLDPLYTS